MRTPPRWHGYQWEWEWHGWHGVVCTHGHDFLLTRWLAVEPAPAEHPSMVTEVHHHDRQQPASRISEMSKSAGNGKGDAIWCARQGSKVQISTLTELNMQYGWNFTQ